MTMVECVETAAETPTVSVGFPTVPGVCAGCGADISHKRGGAGTCGRTCRQRWNRTRQYAGEAADLLAEAYAAAWPLVPYAQAVANAPEPPQVFGDRWYTVPTHLHVHAPRVWVRQPYRSPFAYLDDPASDPDAETFLTVPGFGDRQLSDRKHWLGPPVGSSVAEAPDMAADPTALHALADLWDTAADGFDAEDDARKWRYRDGGPDSPEALRAIWRSAPRVDPERQAQKRGVVDSSDRDSMYTFKIPKPGSEPRWVWQQDNKEERRSRTKTRGWLVEHGHEDLPYLP